MSEDEPLLCPKCQTGAALGDTCPRCDVPLVTRGDLPPWGLRGRLETRPIITPRGALSFGASVAFMLAVSLAFAVGGSRKGGFEVDLLFRAVGLCSLLFVGVTTVADLARGHRMVAQRRRARAALLREAQRLPDLSGAADGARVSAEGVVRVERPAVTDEGVRCAAWQRTARDATTAAEGSEEGPGVTVTARGGPSIHLRLFNGTETRIAAGGVFTLTLDSGERVRVRAEHVTLAEDGDVADGDRVVVAGAVRHTAPEEAAAHHRAESRAVELAGTAEQPLLVRRLSRGAPDARSGVRAAADAAAEGGEAPAATGSAGSRGRA